MNKKEIDRFFRKTEPSTLRRVQKKGYFREEDEGDSEYEDAGSGVTDGDLEDLYDSIPGAGEEYKDFSNSEIYNWVKENLSQFIAQELDEENAYKEIANLIEEFMNEQGKGMNKKETEFTPVDLDALDDPTPKKTRAWDIKDGLRYKW